MIQAKFEFSSSSKSRIAQQINLPASKSVADSDERLYQDELETFRNRSSPAATAVAVRKKLIRIAVEDDYIWSLLQAELRSGPYVTNDAIITALFHTDLLERIVVSQLENSGRVYSRPQRRYRFTKEYSFVRSYAAFPHGAGQLKKFMTETIKVCGKKIGELQSVALSSSQKSVADMHCPINCVRVQSGSVTVEKLTKLNQYEMLEDFPDKARIHVERTRSEKRSSITSARAA